MQMRQSLGASVNKGQKLKQSGSHKKSYRNIKDGEILFNFQIFFLS